MAVLTLIRDAKSSFCIRFVRGVQGLCRQQCIRL